MAVSSLSSLWSDLLDPPHIGAAHCCELWVTKYLACFFIFPWKLSHLSNKGIFFALNMYIHYTLRRAPGRTVDLTYQTNYLTYQTNYRLVLLSLMGQSAVVFVKTNPFETNRPDHKESTGRDQRRFRLWGLPTVCALLFSGTQCT